jgi:hypothetical protein
MRAVLRKAVTVVAAAGKCWAASIDTEGPLFILAPPELSRIFADRRGKNCKTGPRPRITVAAKIAKATHFTNWRVRNSTPRATALQQARNSRFGETPAFAYIYHTNWLLN